MSLKSLQVAPSQAAGGEVRPGHTSIHVQEKKSFCWEGKSFSGENFKYKKKKPFSDDFFFPSVNQSKTFFRSFFFMCETETKGKKKLSWKTFVSHMKIKIKENVKINKLKKYKHFSFSLLKKHFFLKFIYFFS